MDRLLLIHESTLKRLVDKFNFDFRGIDMCAKSLLRHDSELLDKAAYRIHQKMCSENCGESQCVDAIDRCVWYGYVTEVIADLKAEVSK